MNQNDFNNELIIKQKKSIKTLNKIIDSQHKKILTLKETKQTFTLIDNILSLILIITLIILSGLFGFILHWIYY